MDREERLQALNKIEGQLSQYLAADKKNWIQTYLLMSEVQDKELYIRQIVISSTPLYPTILFNLRFNSTKCFPCLIFRAKQP